MQLNLNTDPFGAAVLDYFKFRFRLAKIKVMSDVSIQDKINPAYLFRDYNQMPLLEQKALGLCNGHVLDIGAGAGSHSLFLQSRKIHACALDKSPGCCYVMKQRGLNEVICNDIFSFSGRKFDTILLLMNGIGVAGTLKGLHKLLKHLKLLLTPGGQIIFDSSDIEYIYFEKDGSKWINLNSEYYGEVKYTLSYKKVVGETFNWLFIDKDTINEIASEEGFSFTKLADGKHNDYLAKLTLEHKK